MTELMLLMTSTLWSRIFLNVLAFVIGFTVCTGLDQNPKPMGRFAFGLIYFFAFSMTKAVPSLWLTTAGDNIEVASTVHIALTLGIGALLAFGARRRSLDGYGTPGKAFYAIIPIVNLALLFKFPNGDRVADRTRLALAGRIVAFAFCAVLAVMPGTMLAEAGTQGEKQANITTLPPQRAAAVLALLMNAQAPSKLDDVTFLEGASHDGMTLTLRYRIIGDAFNSMTPEAFQSRLFGYLQKSACSDRNFSYILQNGGSIFYQYSLPGESTPYSAQIEVSSCA